MVGGKRAARLYDDIRLGEGVLLACVDDGVYGIVDIFLYGVVYAVARDGRVSAVIIDPEASADIHEADSVAHLLELDIELHRLFQCCLYAPYVCHLAAYVEVDKLQTVSEILLVEQGESLEQLAGV